MGLHRRIYEWGLRQTPYWFRQMLKTLGFKGMINRWDPRDDPDYVWALSGTLAGVSMQIKSPEDFAFVTGEHEPAVVEALSALVQPGWVCADVGGHIGYFTLLLAQLVGVYGQVMAFEALPDNVSLLNRNIALNGFSERVSIHAGAVVAQSAAAVTLYIGPSSAEASCLRRDAPGVDVPAFALDDVFPAGSRLDLVKMDIEGGEVAAMVGMRRLLSEVRPLVVLEVHEGAWAAVEALHAARYTLLDLRLQPITSPSPASVHHCIAVPVEKSALVGRGICE